MCIAISLFEIFVSHDISVVGKHSNNYNANTSHTHIAFFSLTFFLSDSSYITSITSLSNSECIHYPYFYQSFSPIPHTGDSNCIGTILNCFFIFSICIWSQQLGSVILSVRFDSWPLFIPLQFPIHFPQTSHFKVQLLVITDSLSLLFFLSFFSFHFFIECY